MSDRPLSISTNKLGVISCMSINYSSKNHLVCDSTERTEEMNTLIMILAIYSNTK